MSETEKRSPQTANTTKAYITKDVVAKLLPNTICWDATVRGVPGFAVRAGSRAKTFFLKTRIAGRNRSVKIGRASHWTPEAARTEAKRLLIEIDRGNDPTRAVSADKDAPTVQEISEEWMRHMKATKSASTIKTYQLLLDKFVLPRVGTLKPRQVTDADMAKLHKAMVDTPNQANLSIAVAASMFKWAEKPAQSYRPEGENPCRHIEKYKEKKRTFSFKGDEVQRFAKALGDVAAEGANAYAIAGLKLLYLTGTRLNEVLTLKRSTIDAERRTARLEDRKSGGLPDVYFSDAVMDIIDGLPVQEGNPYLLPGSRRGEHLSESGMRKVWHKVCNKAGLFNEKGKPIRMHDLRHNWGSTGAGLGEALVNFGKQMGHRNTRTTEGYVTVADNNPVRQSAERIQGHLAEALKPKDDTPPADPGDGANVVPLRKSA